MTTDEEAAMVARKMSQQEVDILAAYDFKLMRDELARESLISAPDERLGLKTGLQSDALRSRASRTQAKGKRLKDLLKDLRELEGEDSP